MRSNTFLRAAVALASATALLGACSDSDDEANGSPSPTSSPATTATTRAVVLPQGVAMLPSNDPGADFATLAAGRYRVPLGESLAFDVDVPANTYAHSNGLFLATGKAVLKTEVAGEDYGVPSDACNEDSIVPAGRTVDDLVRAIVQQPSYEVATEPIRLGGAEGSYLEVTVAAGAKRCADGVAVPGTPSSVASFSGDYHGRWWILDLDGQRLVVQQNCACSAHQLDRVGSVPRSIAFTAIS